MNVDNAGSEKVKREIEIQKCLMVVRKLPERRKRERLMYFHYTNPVYSQFILYLYLIYVSIVIIYAE